MDHLKSFKQKFIIDLQSNMNIEVDVVKIRVFDNRNYYDIYNRIKTGEPGG